MQSLTDVVMLILDSDDEPPNAVTIQIGSGKAIRLWIQTLGMRLARFFISGLQFVNFRLKCGSFQFACLFFFVTGTNLPAEG